MHVWLPGPRDGLRSTTSLHGWHHIKQRFCRLGNTNSSGRSDNNRNLLQQNYTIGSPQYQPSVAKAITTAGANLSSSGQVEWPYFSASYSLRFGRRPAFSFKFPAHLGNCMNADL